MLEDDVVAEVYLERPEHRSIAGNVYLGIVDNVLPGMEAAFVEIGLEKNGFLYVDEIVGPELEGRKGARKIQDLIQRGQTIVVQAVKDPMKTKGARLTTEISLPGRFVVFVPHGDGLGVSRRLEDDERNRLKGILKGIAPKEGGVIVRTAAEGASAEDIERDLTFLMQLWKTIEKRAKAAKAPTLVYQEAELPLRVTRDLFTGDFERLVVDHDRTHKRIVGYLKKTSPHMVERVSRYKDRAPLMETSGVEQQIQSTLNRRVDLPSGGYLIFDYAEAFTVIDVNTGRFVGSRSKTSGARLEDTITKNNLEAVKEVVRQLRLRDIGGIIVIDFIDMANPKNRAQVEEALRTELERDRTKTYVVEISPLGLVEMTRQNVTDGPREVMTRKCPTCAGDGIVVSESTTAVELERKLRSLVTPGSRSKAYKVEVNAKIALDARRPGRLAHRGARGADEEAVLPRRARGRASRSLPRARAGHAREARSGGSGRGRPGARAEARRARAARSECRRREGGRLRRRRRRRREARRQEGARPRHRPHGRDRLRGADRRRRERAADHGRGRGRAADPRAAQHEVGGDPRARRRGARGGSRRRDARCRRAAHAHQEEAGRAAAQRRTGLPTASFRGRGFRGRGFRGRGFRRCAAEPKKRSRSRTRKPAGVESETVVADGDAEAALDDAGGRGRGAEAEGDAETATPKKRTRRGTRGGRNRRRKPGAEGESANGAGLEDAGRRRGTGRVSDDASDDAAADGEQSVDDRVCRRRARRSPRGGRTSCPRP